jgi:protein-tyrosine phosphatase
MDSAEVAMREVIPQMLWVGNAREARDISNLLDLGIAAVVDLAIEEAPIVFPRDVVYCRFPLIDGSGNSQALLKAAVETTTSLVCENVPTLVACSGGMSRSPAVVAVALHEPSEPTLTKHCSELRERVRMMFLPHSGSS